MFIVDKHLLPQNPTPLREHDRRRADILEGVYGDTQLHIDIEADIESRSVFSTPTSPHRLSFSGVPAPPSSADEN